MINFKWTAQEDFERMGLKKLIKLEEVKLAGAYSPGLIAIQLSFTEGIKSPLFEANSKYNAVSHKVDLTKTIDSIKVLVESHHLH